jgi:acyl dehydratase
MARARSETLAVGDEAPRLVVEDVSRTHFVRYAGASGDFNPMHHDDTVATSVGNPSVFGHGMLTAGLMARVVKDWFGPTRASTGRADLELLVENADGEPKLTGGATAVVRRD